MRDVAQREHFLRRRKVKGGGSTIVSDILQKSKSNWQPRTTYLLTEFGILVKAQLCVHAQDITTLDLGQRVDLNLCRVTLLEQLVQLDKDVGGLLLRLGLEFELLGGFERGFVRETVVKVDRDGDDSGRSVARDVFDAEGGRAVLVDDCPRAER